jgi:hypothetical protein
LDSGGGWDCGQVDEDARTCLESGGCGGGCGQVDEDPRARLQSGGCGKVDEGPSRSFEKQRVAVGRVGSTKALTLVGRA